MTEIEDFEVNFKSSGALHGFGFAEMPSVIFGGKGEAKRRQLTSYGVNNLWNTRVFFKSIIYHYYGKEYQYNDKKVHSLL